MNACLLNRRTLDTTVLNSLEQEFEQFLGARLIGQPKAKKAARRAFRRTLSKLREGKQPFYTLLELGPTTCGKSELAYLLAEFFHGDRDALLKLDGSEYMDDSQLTKLTGATSQWVGYKDKTDKSYVPPKENEKDPYAELSNHNLRWSRKGSKSPVVIILVDEWEKGCKEFNQVLLSIMRYGVYTLGNGEVVDFSNVILVLTANLGSAAVEDEANHTSIGFGRTKEPMTPARAEKIITDHLRAFAPPEFRSRVDENGEVVIFEELTEDEVGQVRDLKVDALIRVVERRAGIKVTVDKTARQWLLKKCGTVAKINGAVKSEITDAIDNEMIKGTIAKGDNVAVTASSVDADTLSFEASAELLITDGTDPESIALMAGFDLQMQGSHRRGQDVVNEEAVRNAAQSSTTDGAADGAKQETRIMQPFHLTLVSADDSVLGTNLQQLNQLLTNLGITRQATHTDHGVQMQVPGGVAEVNVSKVEVMATVESMLRLREAAPALTIKALGFVL